MANKLTKTFWNGLRVTIILMFLLGIRLTTWAIDSSDEAIVFPDSNFEAVVREIINKPDEPILVLDVEELLTLDVSQRNIHDLTGLAYFTSLKELHINNNNLTSLDLSGNTALVHLDVSGNRLTSLDITDNNSLSTLLVYKNDMASFDCVIGWEDLFEEAGSMGSDSPFQFIPQNIPLTGTLTITLSDITLSPGETLAFTAVAEWGRWTDQSDVGTYLDFEWSVSGNTASDTTISAEGLLTVSPSETAKKLTITVTAFTRDEYILVVGDFNENAAVAITINGPSSSLSELLSNLLDCNDPKVIFNRLKVEINANELTQAMLNDNKIINLVRQLETHYTTLLPGVKFAVETENSPFSQANVSQIGAWLNVPPEGVSQATLRLISSNNDIPSIYNANTAVHADMELLLDGSKFTDRLYFPIRVTILIPQGLSPQNTVILRYTAPNWFVTPSVCEGGSRSFVVTDLIPFSVAERTANIFNISVSPSNIGLIPGASCHFTATVTGTVQSVTWSVMGSTAGSFINDNGLLFVSPYENAPTLTVVARSTFDTAIIGSAIVFVQRPQHYLMPEQNVYPAPTRVPEATSPTSPPPESDIPYYDYTPDNISAPPPAEETADSDISPIIQFEIRDVRLNNRVVSMTQKPVFMNDRTYIPIREVFQSLDFTLEWDHETRTATVQRGKTILEITDGEQYFFKNGYAIWAGGKIEMINGHLMMPFKEVLESIGCISYRDSNNDFYMSY